MFPAFLCDKHCSGEQIRAYFSGSSFQQNNFPKAELQGQVIRTFQRLLIMYYQMAFRQIMLLLVSTSSICVCPISLPPCLH